MVKEFLIIDDDDSSIFLLKAKIEKLGYENKIHTALDGKLGLEFIVNYEKKLCKKSKSKHVLLVIFLDINMPIMNGFEFLESFTNMSENIELIKPTIINMFTSSKNSKDIEKAMGFKFVQGYILKYPESDQLKSFIEKSFNG